MRVFLSIACGACVLAGIAAGATGLEIRVAPATLVLGSGGGNLTVHTNVPFGDAEDVFLEVDGTVLDARLFADDRGFLVAQCDKEAVADVIGGFEGTFTTATVTLSVNGCRASEVIRVRK